MGLGKGGAPVEEDLEDLVVVLVGGEDEGGDVGRVGGRHRIDGLPRVRGAGVPDPLLVLQEQLDALDVLLVDGEEERVEGGDVVLEEELHQLGVLVDDGYGEGRPAEGVDAVDVKDVPPALQGLDQLPDGGAVAPLGQQHEPAGRSRLKPESDVSVSVAGKQCFRLLWKSAVYSFLDQFWTVERQLPFSSTGLLILISWVGWKMRFKICL